MHITVVGCEFKRKKNTLKQFIKNCKQNFVGKNHVRFSEKTLRNKIMKIIRYRVLNYEIRRHLL